MPHAVVRGPNGFDRRRLMLRICVLGNVDSIHVRRWIEGLASDHEVHAVAMRQPAQAAPRGCTLHVIDDQNPRPVVIAGQAAARRMPVVARRMAIVARSFRLRLGDAIRDIRPDIVQAHYVSDWGLIAAAHRLHPLVITAWGSDILVDARGTPGRMLASWALQRADLLTYDADIVGAALGHLASATPRMKVVFGLEDEVFQTPIDGARDSKVLTIASVRALRPMYDVATIIRAFGRIASRHATRLVIAGGGEERRELIRLASLLCPADSVSFVGQLPREQLLTLLRSSHVYVSAALSDATSASLLEAMACGAFPVVTDLPANREWLHSGESGILFPRGDVNSLVKSFEIALSNPQLRQRAAVLNRSVVEEKANWPRELVRVAAAYASLQRSR